MRKVAIDKIYRIVNFMGNTRYQLTQTETFFQSG